MNGKSKFDWLHNHRVWFPLLFTVFNLSIVFLYLLAYRCEQPIWLAVWCLAAPELKIWGVHKTVPHRVLTFSISMCKMCFYRLRISPFSRYLSSKFLQVAGFKYRLYWMHLTWFQVQRLYFSPLLQWGFSLELVDLQCQRIWLTDGE